jgi:hydrogenase maturation protease
MTPDAVLRLTALLGGGPRRVLLVGCVPERVEEGLGLSPPVAAAVAPADQLVRAVLAAAPAPSEERSLP